VLQRHSLILPDHRPQRISFLPSCLPGNNEIVIAEIVGEKKQRNQLIKKTVSSKLVW